MFEACSNAAVFMPAGLCSNSLDLPWQIPWQLLFHGYRGVAVVFTVVLPRVLIQNSLSVKVCF
jgi:hypothetical protein